MQRSESKCQSYERHSRNNCRFSGHWAWQYSHAGETPSWQARTREKLGGGSTMMKGLSKELRRPAATTSRRRSTVSVHLDWRLRETWHGRLLVEPPYLIIYRQRNIQHSCDQTALSEGYTIQRNEGSSICHPPMTEQAQKHTADPLLRQWCLCTWTTEVFHSRTGYDVIAEDRHATDEE